MHSSVPLIHSFVKNLLPLNIKQNAPINEIPGAIHYIQKYYLHVVDFHLTL